MAAGGGAGRGGGMPTGAWLTGAGFAGAGLAEGAGPTEAGALWAGGLGGRSREGLVLPTRCGRERALWGPQVRRVRGRFRVAFGGEGKWGQFRDWRKARGGTLLLGPQVGRGREGGQ